MAAPPQTITISITATAISCDRTVPTPPTPPISTPKSSGTSTTSPPSTTSSQSITSSEVSVLVSGLKDIVPVTPPGTPQPPVRIPAMSKPPFFPIQTKWG
jgi:hypothetical protein